MLLTMFKTKFNFASISRWLSLCLTSLLLCACSGYDMEDEVPDAGSSKKLSLGFYINVGEVDNTSTNISRATPADGEYDPGAGYENFIDLEGGDFRIYFFSVDNKFISTFTNPVIERVDIQNSPSSKTYVARTSIEGKDMIEQIKNGPTKIVMLANWHGKYLDEASLIPGETTIDQLVNNAIIDYGTEPWGAVLDYEHRIPLYGVMQFPGVNLVPVMLNLTGVDLHLLRAFAKVEVIQTEESAANIESVSLKRHNTKAYCAPLGVYHQSQYIKHTYGGDYTDNPSIPADAISDTELNVPFYTDETGLRHYVIYVPEYKNTGANMMSADKTHLNIKLENDDRNYKVEFKYYQVPPALTGAVKVGQYFDLMRNFWYKFEVTKKISDVDMDIQVDVLPYGIVDLRPSFGLD